MSSIKRLQNKTRRGRRIANNTRKSNWDKISIGNDGDFDSSVSYSVRF